MILILYGRIPSKKNSKKIVVRGKRPLILSSDDYIAWEKQQINELRGVEMEVGVFSITCEFYLPDRRKTDLSNKFESIADMLVKAGILEDDNCSVLKEVHLKYMGVDKENPRVEINLKEIG